MGLPGPVCRGEGLDREHCAWAGDLQSGRLGSLGKTYSVVFYLSQVIFSNCTKSGLYGVSRLQFKQY